MHVQREREGEGGREGGRLLGNNATLERVMSHVERGLLTHCRDLVFSGHMLMTMDFSPLFFFLRAHADDDRLRLYCAEICPDVLHDDATICAHCVSTACVADGGHARHRYHHGPQSLHHGRSRCLVHHAASLVLVHHLSRTRGYEAHLWLKPTSRCQLAL